MRDNSWNKQSLDIPLRRPVEVFIPNVNSIDMDTTGTWPFGRRPEDQVATRFLSLFLDHTAEINGVKYSVELLNQQWLWDASPIDPKNAARIPSRTTRSSLRTSPIWRSLGNARVDGNSL